MFFTSMPLIDSAAAQSPVRCAAAAPISMVRSLPENEDVKVAPWKDRQPHRASLPGENRLDQGRGTLYMQLNLVR